MKIRIFFPLILFLCINISAQRRDFSKWDHTAFCSYTRYHPHTYLKSDNNWDILQELCTPQTRQHLDSIGIKTTNSQMMLLRIEGFIEQEGNKWVSLIPILDSLQTVEARSFSLDVARNIYPNIKKHCSMLVDFLKEEKLSESIYTILFSYILDGEIWKHFNSYEDLKTSATWAGECWALYTPRKFASGTNSYNNFNVCWSENQPEYVWKELNYTTFINPFLKEYKLNGKIVSSDMCRKALALGLVEKDGSLRIPIINSKDQNSKLNVFSNKIIEPIVQYFNSTDIVGDFQKAFGIHIDKKKLACTMLYHEVMWDLIDLLLADNVIEYPNLWINKDKKFINSIVYIEE